ncbi:hypothetical protein MASR2M15_15410 [Anaerolineales bacterium]
MINNEPMSFETAYARLQDIVSQMEGEQLALDEMMRLFREGQSLASFCQQLLDNAQLEIEEIVDSGQMKLL